MTLISKIKAFLFGGSSIEETPLKPEEEEKTLEELYPDMTDEEICEQIMQKDEDELTTDELCMKLGMTLHNEHTSRRHRVIEQLINEQYGALDTESRAPDKELVDFVLNQLKKGLMADRVTSEQLIKSSFPTMSPYILRYLNRTISRPSLSQIRIDGMDRINRIRMNRQADIDTQKSYQEFVDFCITTFCLKYPDQETRDQAINREFNYYGPTLIKLIHGHMEKQRDNNV